MQDAWTAILLDAIKVKIPNGWSGCQERVTICAWKLPIARYEVHQRNGR